MTRRKAHDDEDGRQRGDPEDGRQGDDAEEELSSSIAARAMQLQGVQAKAREMGIFTADRELLSCPKCDLMEDVLVGGQLITCRAQSLGEDTGLRFIENSQEEGRFTCPE